MRSGTKTTALLALALTSAPGCSGLSGDAPRAAPQSAVTEQESGTLTTDPATLSLYAYSCEGCHGSITTLTTPAGQKKGNLLGATGPIIKEYCAGPTTAPLAALDVIGKALVKLGKGPAKRTKKPVFPPPLSPLPPVAPTPPPTETPAATVVPLR